MTKSGRPTDKGSKAVEVFYEVNELNIESILRDIKKYNMDNPDDSQPRPPSSSVMDYNEFKLGTDKCSVGAVNVNPTFIIHEAPALGDHSGRSSLHLEVLALTLIAILIALLGLIYVVYRLYRAFEKKNEVRPPVNFHVHTSPGIYLSNLPPNVHFNAEKDPSLAFTRRYSAITDGNSNKQDASKMLDADHELNKSKAASTDSSPGLNAAKEPPVPALKPIESETKALCKDSNTGASLEERRGSVSRSDEAGKQKDSSNKQYNYLMDYAQAKQSSARFSLNKHLSSGFQTNCKDISGMKFMLADMDTLPLEDGKFKKSFTKSESIGRGSYGEVYKAIHKLDGKIYAVKRIELDESEIADMKKYGIFREVMAMAGINHDNVVR